MSQPLPLVGIRIIDYSHFLAGPFMSRALAALGAEVIKVERPTEGDAGRAHATILEKNTSGYFLQQNMGKQGLCIDLKDQRGLAPLHKLVARADVFVENYRPGALDRLGLGYKQLSAINPRLVYCSVSAYGHTGPDSSRPGFGLIAEARSGAMAQLGVPGQPPPLLRIPVADMYAGIHGVAAVCAALLGRVGSGRGQHIDMALHDCMISIHDYAVQRYTMSGDTEIPVQTGSDQPESTVCGVFPAKGGNLVIAAQVEDAWKRLATLIGGEALAADPRFHGQDNRNANRLAALELVRTWTMAQPSRAACTAALDAAAVPCAPVNTIDEVLADPQTIARGMVVEQDHPVAGRVRLPNLPFRFSDCDTAQHSPAPLLGQHNRQIAARSAARRTRSMRCCGTACSTQNRLSPPCHREPQHDRPLCRDRQPDRPHHVAHDPDGLRRTSRPGQEDRTMSRLVFILNGPNLNLLGECQPQIYGYETLADVERDCRAVGEELNLKLRFHQSNREHEIVDWIHEARKVANGIVINPAAFTHTSFPILDALNTFEPPVIELHIATVYKREGLRHRSFVSARAVGVMAGFGTQGDQLALRRVAKLIDDKAA